MLQRIIWGQTTDWSYLSRKSLTVYDFFRSKPFNRYYSAKNGLDRLQLGNWKDGQTRSIISLVVAIGFIAISFAFALYYLFIYLVSKESYLWLSLILFQATAMILTTYPSGMYLGLSLWLTFSAINLTNYAILFILLLQFFRKILILPDLHPRINKIFITGIIFYAVLIPIYVIESFNWPEGGPFTDLLKHPPDNRGAGFIPLPFMVIPFAFLLITAIVISFKRWRKGDAVCRLSLPFLLPAVSLAPYVGCFLHLQNVWLGNLISDRRWQDLVSCHVHHFRVCRGPTNERVEEDSTGAADETDGSLPTLCSQSTAQQS